MNIEKKPYELSIWEDVSTYLIKWADGTELEVYKENLPSYSEDAYKFKVNTTIKAIRQDGSYLNLIAETNENIIKYCNALYTTQVTTLLNSIDITDDSTGVNSISTILTTINELDNGSSPVNWVSAGLKKNTETFESVKTNYLSVCHPAVIEISAFSELGESNIFTFSDIVKSSHTSGTDTKTADLEFIYLSDPAGSYVPYFKLMNEDDVVLNAPEYKISNVTFYYNTTYNLWIPNFLTATSADAFSSFKISHYNKLYTIKYSYIKERKKAFLGSDAANNQIKAFSPKLTQNINGTNSLEFSVYYLYYDEIEEKDLDNPLVNLLINERKIKLFYDEKWYDFIIKSYKKDSVNRTITYSCTDALINELSKIGFDVEFDTDQLNNMGNVSSLAAKTLESTDWRAVGTSGEVVNETTVGIKYKYNWPLEETDLAPGDMYHYNNNDYRLITLNNEEVWILNDTLHYSLAKGYYISAHTRIYYKETKITPATLSTGEILISDYILQTNNETLFKCRLKDSITAYPQLGGNSISIGYNEYIYVFYTVLTEGVSFFLFLYIPGAQGQDTPYLEYLNDEGVAIGCPAYYIEGVSLSYREGVKLYAPDFIDTIKTNLTFRGLRIVKSPITRYSSLFNRYVNLYKHNNRNRTYYGFKETEYLTPAYVINYVVNGKDFESTTGWDTGVYSVNTPLPTIERKLLNNYYGEPDLSSNIIAHLHLYVNFQSLAEPYSNCLVNEGLQDYLSVYGHFTKGLKIVLRYNAVNANGTYTAQNPPKMSDNLTFKIATYTKEGNIYTLDDTLFVFSDTIDDWNMDYDSCNLSENEVIPDTYLFYYQIAECTKSLTKELLLEKKIGLFIERDSSYYPEFYIREIQLFNFESSNTAETYSKNSEQLSLLLKELYKYRIYATNKRDEWLGKYNTILSNKLYIEGKINAYGTSYYRTGTQTISFTKLDTLTSLFTDMTWGKAFAMLSLYMVQAKIIDKKSTILVGEGEYITSKNLFAYLTWDVDRDNSVVIFNYLSFTRFILGLFSGTRTAISYPNWFLDFCKFFFAHNLTSEQTTLTAAKLYDIRAVLIREGNGLGFDDLATYELFASEYISKKLTYDLQLINTNLKINQEEAKLTNYSGFAEINSITIDTPETGEVYWTLSYLYNHGNPGLAYLIGYARSRNAAEYGVAPLPKAPGDSLSYDLLTKYYYYESKFENNEKYTVGQVEFEYENTAPWTSVTLQYSNSYEKIRSIEAKESSCYNIIMTICETFECWARFTADRVLDSNGKETGEIKCDLHKYYRQLTNEEKTKSPDTTIHYFTLDDNQNYIDIGTPSIFEEDTDYYIEVYYYGLRKYISFHKYTGDENHAGFKYGINLNSITRNIDSNNIISKLIVKENSNLFAENGMCTIANSLYNETGENSIFNFAYYVRLGLIDGDSLQNDLYGTGFGGLGYYRKVKYINNLLKPYNEEQACILIEFTNADSNKTVIEKSLESAQNELANKRQYLYEYSGNVYTYEDVIETDEYGLHIFPYYDKGSYRSLAETIYSLIRTVENLTKLYAKAIERYDFYADRLEKINKIISDFTLLKKQLMLEFTAKYSRFIQEGYWVDEEYTDADLYYLDAEKVIYSSSNPLLSYEIKVTALDGLEDYKNYNFKIGNITYVEDPEYFGYTYKNNIKTPYHEKIVITEVVFYLDTPQSNTIKVLNYKPDFENLFQKIASTVSKLNLSEGAYDTASSAISSDGTIAKEYIQNTFDLSSFVLSNINDLSVVWDSTGITITDKLNPNYLVRLVATGIILSDDCGTTWKTGITGKGINTAVLAAGKINTSEINLYSGEHTSFRWDYTGLNAYYKAIESGISTFKLGKFVRMDHFGLYGYDGAYDIDDTTGDDNEEGEFIPNSLSDVLTNNGVRFALTWQGLALRTNRYDYTINNVKKYGGIFITPDEDFVVKDGAGLTRVHIGTLAEGTSSSRAIYGMLLFDANDNTTLVTTDAGKLWLKDTLQISDNLTASGVQYARAKIGKMGTYNSWSGAIPYYTPDPSKTIFHEVINVKDDGKLEDGTQGIPQDRFRVFDDGTVVIMGRLILGEKAEIYTNKLYAIPYPESGNKEDQGYLLVDPTKLTIYAPKRANHTQPERFKLGYDEAGQYSYIQFKIGGVDTDNRTQGLIKRYPNGLWFGNSNSLNQSCDFDTDHPAKDDTGIFVDLTNHAIDAKTYVVYNGVAVPFIVGDTVARFG